MKGALAIAALLAFACDPSSAPPRASAAPAPAPPAEDRALSAVPGASLCVTSGAALAREGARFAVDSPTFRAVSSRASARAQLSFVYRGPTDATRALGSGELRRQLGLKLRAHDPCNLLYAMWRIDERGAGKLVVQVKRNDGRTRSAECGNEGYQTVSPRETAPLPSLTTGAAHALRAEIDGAELRVLVDGALAWAGTLPRQAVDLEGPVGVRSDNIRFDGELALGSGIAIPCATSDEAE